MRVAIAQRINTENSRVDAVVRSVAADVARSRSCVDSLLENINASIPSFGGSSIFSGLLSSLASQACQLVQSTTENATNQVNSAIGSVGSAIPSVPGIPTGGNSSGSTVGGSGSSVGTPPFIGSTPVIVQPQPGQGGSTGQGSTGQGSSSSGQSGSSNQGSSGQQGSSSIWQQLLNAVF